MFFFTSQNHVSSSSVAVWG